MNFDFQNILVGIIVAGAAFTLIKKFIPKKDAACGKGCDKCDTVKESK